MKVSVIVPVYNVEKYLDKCLNSLVNQTLDDIEIIIVNDESPDNSQSIIDKYKELYSDKIVSIIQKNTGVSGARNHGIEIARGDYIAFIDGDDYVSLDMFEKMYNKAIEKNFDLVVCDLNYIFENGKTKCISSQIEKDVFKIKEIFVNQYPSPCNKIYKKELFDSGICFKNRVWFEDVELLFRLFMDVKSIGVVKEPLLQYVQREGSVTHVFNHKLYDYIDNWNGIIKYYKDHNKYDEYKNELEASYVRYLFATFVKRLAKTRNKKEYNRGVELVINEVNSNFPDYKKNPYLKKGLKNAYLRHFNKYLAKLIYLIEK